MLVAAAWPAETAFLACSAGFLLAVSLSTLRTTGPWAEVALSLVAAMAATADPAVGSRDLTLISFGSSFALAAYAIRRHPLLDRCDAAAARHIGLGVFVIAGLAGAASSTLLALGPAIGDGIGDGWGQSLDVRSVEWATATAALTLFLAGGVVLIRLALMARGERTDDSPNRT